MIYRNGVPILDASQIISGTLALARLSDITNAQLAAAAGLLLTQMEAGVCSEAEADDKITAHTGVPAAHHTVFTNAEHDVVARHPLANLVNTVCSEAEAAALIAAALPVAKLETRDLTAGSGNVAYTGYGFRPTGLIITADRTTTAMSIGSSEPALAQQAMIIKVNVTPDIKDGNIVWVEQAAGDYQQAVVSSYDVDGFTLTWTKQGNPTGAADLHVFAFR